MHSKLVGLHHVHVMHLHVTFCPSNSLFTRSRTLIHIDNFMLLKRNRSCFSGYLLEQFSSLSSEWTMFFPCEIIVWYNRHLCFLPHSTRSRNLEFLLDMNRVCIVSLCANKILILPVYVICNVHVWLECSFSGNIWMLLLCPYSPFEPVFACIVSDRSTWSNDGWALGVALGDLD